MQVVPIAPLASNPNIVLQGLAAKVQRPEQASLRYEAATIATWANQGWPAPSPYDPHSDDDDGAPGEHSAMPAPRSMPRNSNSTASLRTLVHADEGAPARGSLEELMEGWPGTRDAVTELIWCPHHSLPNSQGNVADAAAGSGQRIIHEGRCGANSG